MTDQKNDAPLLLIRVDATRATGLGHAVRCLAVAEAWRERGGRVTVYGDVEGPQGLVRRWFEAVGVEVVRPPLPSDDFAAFARDAGPEAVVLDGYDLPIPPTRFGLPATQVTNLCAEDLAGPNAPLRRAVVWARTSPPSTPLDRDRARPPRIVMATGGADHGDLSTRLCWALRNVAARHGAEVVAVAGPWSRLRVEPPERLPLCVRVVTCPDAQTWVDLLTSDAPTVCVTAGGTTLWELAYLGVPAVALGVAGNQAPNLRRVEEVGCAVVTAPVRAPLAVDALLSFSALYDRMAQAGPAYMGTGNGAARLVERL